MLYSLMFYLTNIPRLHLWAYATLAYVIYYLLQVVKVRFSSIKNTFLNLQKILIENVYYSVQLWPVQMDPLKSFYTIIYRL